jgi:hypothetical protein
MRWDANEALSDAELKVEKQAWSECIKDFKFVRAVVTAREQARRAQEEAKEWDKGHAASEKSSCDQDRYWCAKRDQCIKTDTECRYLHSDHTLRGRQSDIMPFARR